LLSANSQKLVKDALETSDDNIALLNNFLALCLLGLELFSYFEVLQSNYAYAEVGRVRQALTMQGAN
jgi:hypothetical protein